VADVIGSGPERPPGSLRTPGARLPRRQPPSWLTVLMIAIALAAAVRQWGGVSAPRAAQYRLPPLPQITVGPTPSGTPARFHLQAEEVAAPAGLRLLIGGTHPSIADPRTGALRGLWLPPISRQQSAQYSRLPGATAVTVVGFSSRAVVTYLVPDQGAPISLGRGVDVVIPARDGGLLGHVAATSRTREMLVSYTADGQVRWSRPLDASTTLIRDTPYGLLVGSGPPPGVPVGPLQLVDARSGRVLREFGNAGWILDSVDNLVAWVPARCEDCPIELNSLSTSDSREYPPVHGHPPARAEFSPDGRRLAVSYSGLHLEQQLPPLVDRDGFVAVLDLPTGLLRAMPGLTTGAKQAATIAWRDADTLVVGVNVDDAADRVLLWDITQVPEPPAPARLLPARLPPYSAADYLGVLG
jgi:hypothetical protein